MKAPKEKVRGHGGGVESVYAPRLTKAREALSASGTARPVFSYRVNYYLANNGPDHGRRVVEPVPPDPETGEHKLSLARRLRAQRELDRFKPGFVPPTWERKRAKVAAKVEQVEAEPLLFENAAARFLKACADDYADPGSVRCRLRRLEPWLKGKRLDQITRLDVRRFYQHRIEGTGPYASWPREVGPRTPQCELTTLSALFTWLQTDEGREELENPVHTPRSRRKARGAFRTYRPVRKRVIPTRAQVAKLLKTAGELKRVSASVTPAQLRGFLTLLAFTGCRPESEAARIRHGDVTLPSETVRAMDGGDAWGEVTFRATKTGEDRTVPLHPIAVTALRPCMVPRPADERVVEAWISRHVFVLRGDSRRPWDRTTYRKAWCALRAAVGLPDMVVRDLRPMVRTRLTEARVPEPVVRRILGHAVDVSGSYYELAPGEAQRALATLELDAVSDATINDNSVRERQQR